jgi:hypothetical protein
MAHEVAEIGAGHRPPAFAQKHEVERAQDVGRGVDQRAVEIEDEGRGVIHRRGLARGGAEARGNRWSQIVFLPLFRGRIGGVI